jgi:hypothetical protein
VIVAGPGTVFANALSGAGGLYLTQGSLTVAGTNTYTGATNVGNNLGNAAATLVLPNSKSIASSSQISINKNGVLDASQGWVFNANQPVSIKDKGQLKIKSSTDFTNANLVIDPVAATELNANKPIYFVDNSTNPININIKLDLSANRYTDFIAHPYVGATNTSAFVGGSYTGTITGSVTSASPLYVLSTTNTVTNIQRVSFSSFARGTAAQNFGAYLDQQVGNGNTVDKTLINIETNVTDAAVISKILQEESAQPFADMFRTGVHRSLAVLGGLEDRVSSIATSRTGNESVAKLGVKQVRPMAKSNAPAAPAPSGEDGWDAWASDEAGTQIGIERRIGDLTIGLTGATGWGRTRFESPEVRINSDSWHIGLYTVAPIGPVTLDASVMYGYADNDSTRTPHVAALVPALGPDVQNHGRFDSQDLTLSLGAAYNMLPADSAFQAAPVLRLTFVDYTQSGFGETNQTAAGAGAYNVGKMSASTFLSKLGYRVSYNVRSGSTEYGADLAAYWQHDWDNKGRGVDVSMKDGAAGTSYRAVGRKDSSDSVLINGGLQATFDDKYFIRGSGAIEFGGIRQDLIGTVTVGVKF